MRRKEIEGYGWDDADPCSSAVTDAWCCDTEGVRHE